MAQIGQNTTKKGKQIKPASGQLLSNFVIFYRWEKNSELLLALPGGGGGGLSSQNY